MKILKDQPTMAMLAPNHYDCSTERSAFDRLAALTAYGIPDAPREASLDAIVQLAAAILEAPMAAICLVADKRLWLPAELGLGLSQIPLEESQSAHVLLQSGIISIPDLASAPSRDGIPFIAAIPGVRFYAGAGLSTPYGTPLGVLCVLDTKPRPDGINEHQYKALQTLADQIVGHLERRRLETVLHRTEQQLDTVFNQVRVGILQRDFNHRVLMVNEQFCRLVGRSADELTGLPMSAFTHPDDVAWNQRVFEERLQYGQPFQVEKRYVRPDGTVVWCNVHVTFVRDKKGNLTSTIAVVDDITDRRAAEQEVWASRELLQTVIDSLPDIIFVKDQTGRLVLVNRTASEHLGLRAGSLEEGRIPAQSIQTHFHHDRHVMMSGTPLALDEVIEIQGEKRILHNVKVPWFRGGKAVGVVSVARDVTESMRALEALRESEEHYRFSVELSPQVPWTATPDGRIDEVGPRWASLTGMDPAEARGNGWIAAIHPDDASATRIAWADAVQSGKPFDVEYRIRTVEGNYRWCRARASPRLDKDGRIVRWYGTLEDVHDHRLASEAVRASEEQLQLAIEAAGIGIWDCDLRSGALRWSDHLRDIFGLDQASPARLETVLPLIHPDDRDEAEVLLSGQGSAAGEAFKSCFRLRPGADSDWRWLAVDGRRLTDQHGAPRRLILSIRDITERRIADERVRWAATHDSLTRLPNRSLFQERLNEALAHAAATAGKVGLLLLDVDEFKRINDSLGHIAGDALLKELSKRLQATVGSDALVARLAGDEFVILLEQVASVDAMEAIAHAVLDRLRQPFSYEGRTLDCRASIGASLFPDHAADPVELFKHADIALYTAKKAGRGGLELFRPEMRADMQRRISMLHLAREALDSRQVFPFYQPKVDLVSGRIIGFEALLRWRHAQGIQPPATIAAAFEEFELAVGLGQRMFECVLADMQRWRRQGIDFGHVAINVSAAEFRSGDLAERMLSGLQAAGISPDLLELEVTETVFLGSGSGDVERALKALSEAGVRIALDDFGTGYASLSHLKQFPVDILKIDRSFVRNLETNASDAAIVSTVITLGQSLGIAIVAEGIETPAQADYLRSRGCAFGQGYMYGKPMSSNDAERLLAEWDPRRIAASSQGSD